MSKFKKIFATMIGTAMSANVLLTMPFSVFADNISQTFEFDGYTVGYEVENSWGNTEVIALTLTNTGTETIEDWMLYFDPNGEIQYVNDAVQMTTTNGIGYIKNPGYNADIDPGASVEFHYAVNDCEEIPSDYKFCQSRMTKETGYDVSLKVNYTWGNNNEYFNGEIIIQNDTDAPIEAWELKADTNFTITEITNSWAADVTELEPYNYMLKGTYTSIIPAGGSVSLGFNGMKEGEPIISDYSLTEVVVDESLINSFNWSDWEDMLDTDGDGIPDEIEEEIGTDPLNSDTDGDGVPDGYELLTIGSDPTNANSLDSDISDGDYDNDQDELSNYEEYLLGTDPNRDDSDYDGLSDGDEINTYGTDPLNLDTDGDGLSDGDETALGLNPLVADSDGDGVLDNEEKFSQSLDYSVEDSDSPIESVSVAFDGTGYIKSNTSIQSVMGIDIMSSNVVGLIGEPFSLTSTSSFDTANITFAINEAALGDAEFENLTMLWYDIENQKYVEMEKAIDKENMTVSATVNHFSTYMIVDNTQWYNAWKDNIYPMNGATMHASITIDCSNSMNWNDPERYRVIAAKGFVNVMSVADMASVILFASYGNEEQDLTNDKDALKDAIDKVSAAGTTNYEDALRYSIDSLDVENNQDSENVIIFLSDGYPTDSSGLNISEEDFDYSLVDEAAEKGIRIYTIGLKDGVDETILKKMASRTNGEYYYASTAAELIEYFLTINMGEKYDITTDTDGDGIPDLFEIYGMPIANGQVLYSDPNVSDTDGDGLHDGEEVIMHIVDDADEVKAAYNYMYNYIPEAFISDNGGIYFTMNSDPSKTDTDGDLDPDNADPNPMQYQLNGYFSRKMGELQLAAQEYLKDSYKPSSSDDYYGKKDMWLTFAFLRCFNKNYNWNHSSWNSAAGELSEKQFNSFKNFLNSNSDYNEIYNYFISTTEINAGDIGEQIDLYHMCATLSAYSYDGFAKAFVGKEYINNLCGWSGDFQTLMNSAYNKTYNTNQYDTIYNAFYNQMGKANDYFSKDDLYADIVSLGINKGFSKNRNESLENIFNSYFVYSKTADFVKDLGNILSLANVKEYTKKYTFDFFVTKKIDQYNAKYNISNKDIQNGINAFVDYLYDNYGCEIK